MVQEDGEFGRSIERLEQEIEDCSRALSIPGYPDKHDDYEMSATRGALEVARREYFERTGRDLYSTKRS